jgi:hypothetical protein
MSRRTLVDLVLHLYPKAWRDRYGEEVRDLMSEVTEQGDSSSAKAALGLFASAFAWRMRTSWRTLAFTGTILAFAGAAVFVVNSVEYGQPSGNAVAAHKVQPKVDPQSAPTQSAHTPTGSATQTPTAGPIPESAVNPAFSNGIDLAQVPDFIPTMSNGKVVGYVSKSQLFPTSSAFQGPPVAASSNGATPSPSAADIAAVDAGSILTVYGPDLTTIIGHMYPGQIFVPTGQTPPPYTAPHGYELTAPTSPPPGAG